MHPDLETLILYRDGELAASRAYLLERHMDACEMCRLEHRRVCQSVAEVEAEDAALTPDPGLLAGALAGIRKWDTAASQPSGRGGVRSRVARELEAYLGPAATHKILSKVADDGNNLLSTIEPVLALFMGRQAASVFVSHVVDAAIVRA